MNAGEAMFIFWIGMTVGAAITWWIMWGVIKDYRQRMSELINWRRG